MILEWWFKYFKIIKRILKKGKYYLCLEYFKDSINILKLLKSK
jgi:hypothetical protein